MLPGGSDYLDLLEDLYDWAIIFVSERRLGADWLYTSGEPSLSSKLDWSSKDSDTRGS